MFLIELILAQALGILGHWANRYVQERTGQDFISYLKDKWAYSVASGSAGLASAFTIYTSTPEGTSGKALVLILIGAYVSGFTLDSKFNRETPPEPDPNAAFKKEVKPQGLDALKKEVQRDQNKNLNDLLADES